MQFPLLTVPLSWQGPMHFHYRDSKITIAIIAIAILSLSTTKHPFTLFILCLLGFQEAFNLTMYSLQSIS